MSSSSSSSIVGTRMDAATQPNSAAAAAAVDALLHAAAAVDASRLTPTSPSTAAPLVKLPLPSATSPLPLPPPPLSASLSDHLEGSAVSSPPPSYTVVPPPKPSALTLQFEPTSETTHESVDAASIDGSDSRSFWGGQNGLTSKPTVNCAESFRVDDGGPHPSAQTNPSLTEHEESLSSTSHAPLAHPFFHGSSEESCPATPSTAPTLPTNMASPSLFRGAPSSNGTLPSFKDATSRSVQMTHLNPMSMGPGVPTADGSALTPSDLRECRSILQSLLRHPLAWPFLAPVDPVAAMAPDYFDVVKKPMDLSSINQKLSSSRASSSIGVVNHSFGPSFALSQNAPGVAKSGGKQPPLHPYRSAAEFVADIRLMLDNCFLYNPPVNQIHQLGRSLEAHFISLVQRSFPLFPDWVKGGSEIPLFINGISYISKVVESPIAAVPNIDGDPTFLGTRPRSESVISDTMNGAIVPEADEIHSSSGVLIANPTPVVFPSRPTRERKPKRIYEPEEFHRSSGSTEGRSRKRVVPVNPPVPGLTPMQRAKSLTGSKLSSVCGSSRGPLEVGMLLDVIEKAYNSAVDPKSGELKSTVMKDQITTLAASLALFDEFSLFKNSHHYTSFAPGRKKDKKSKRGSTAELMALAGALEATGTLDSDSSDSSDSDSSDSSSSGSEVDMDDVPHGDGGSVPAAPASSGKPAAKVSGPNRTSSTGGSMKPKKKSHGSTVPPPKPPPPKRRRVTATPASSSVTPTPTALPAGAFVGGPSSPTASGGGRICEYCGITSTPMWRKGPSGRGTLCNRCGVKWRQNRLDMDQSVMRKLQSNGGPVVNSNSLVPTVVSVKTSPSKLGSPSPPDPPGPSQAAPSTAATPTPAARPMTPKIPSSESTSLETPLTKPRPKSITSTRSPMNISKHSTAPSAPNAPVTASSSQSVLGADGQPAPPPNTVAPPPSKKKKPQPKAKPQPLLQPPLPQPTPPLQASLHAGTAPSSIPFEERMRLAEQLAGLSEQHLSSCVMVVQSRQAPGGGLSEGEEVELDVDTLDPTTFTILDMHVQQCLEEESEMKRRARAAAQRAAEQLKRNRVGDV